MSLEIDYTKLSERGLRDLINQDDHKALDEFTRRVNTGEIKRQRHSIEEFEKIWNNRTSQNK